MKKLIKMFYLVYGLSSGGIERISVGIFKYINHEKIDMKMITKYADREFFDEELEKYGGHRTPILTNVPKNKIINKILYTFNTIKAINKGYDVAYFCLSKPRDVFKYPLLCKIFGIKTLVVHSHNSMEDKDSPIIRLMNYLGRMYIGKIATIKIACSEKAAMWMFPSDVYKEKKYIQMNNGIDVKDYTYNEKIRREIRSRYNVESKFVVGHVGRFTKQKNHKFLIDIFEQICMKCKDSQLVLIGVGELENDIKEYVKLKKLNDKVLFMGQKNNVNEYMQMFDVFLFPSLYEGLPVVGIEAQATGLKCFFSDIITKEVNITGNVTYISLKENAKTWADMVIEKGINYERKDVSDKIKTAGFDIEASAKEWEKLIIKICQKK